MNNQNATEKKTQTRSERAAELNETRRTFREIVARGEAAGSLDRGTVQKMRRHLYMDRYNRFGPAR